ncbi:MAG: hypothetical protein DIU78_011120 [Pseudomonadota bacterium]|nr:MAG: hypothetical protein DIU78_01730 [Pseudomonadota bacterium]
MRRWPVCSALLVSAFATLGCASDREGLERRLAELADDIARLQAKNDRLSERLDALETQQSAATPAAPAATPAPAAERVERPPLKVVKLEPPEDLPLSRPKSPEVAPEERPDAPGDRPVIRLRGKGEPGNASRSTASVKVVEGEERR